MSELTKISWCDSTFNPWMGCTKVSPACDHCYAERDTKRFGRVQWGAGQPRVRTTAAWKDPKRWNDKPFHECGVCGYRGDDFTDACPACHTSNHIVAARRRVFSASLADWLDNEVPIEWLVDLLDLIRRTPNLDWLLLTKRIGNWHARMDAAFQATTSAQLELFIDDWRHNKPPANVWIGATVINQDEADRDVPKLLRVPAAIRFLSIEPMLGVIDLNKCLPAVHCEQCNADYGALSVHAVDQPIGLHWIICGGESGPHARPMHPDWVRSLRDQCAAARVAFHFKQWGGWVERAPDHGRVLPWVSEETDRSNDRVIDASGDGSDHTNCCVPHSGRYALMTKIGKAAAGRLLDGREHNEFPAVPA